MKTALVLCGGGAHGAMEVGLYKALEELHIPFEFIVGSSIGAINGAMIAAGVSPAELEATWRRLRSRNVLRFKGWWMKLLGNASGLCDCQQLERLLTSVLPVQQFSQLRRPLQVVATDLESGEAVVFDQGNLVEALLASCALPGLFPPRRHGQRWLIDGGVTANSPVWVAEQMGANKAILYPCRCRMVSETPVRFFNVVQQALSLLIQSQEKSQIKSVAGKMEVLVLSTCPNQQVGWLDFDHAHSLIEPAYRSALQQLAELHSQIS